MNLYLDIGNSRIKWALAAANGELLHVGGVENTRFDVLQESFTELAMRSAPQQIIAVSVATDAVYRQTLEIIEACWSLPVQKFGSVAEACGVKNAYSEPASLGADRWSALIGAHRLFDKAVLIADCGTAISLDVLSADGEHRGGYIVPGLQMMRGALHGGTAALPMVGAGRPGIAANTHDAIVAGTVLAAAAAVEHAAVRHGEKADTPLHLVMTGGDADRLSQFITIPFSYEPHLVLKGLVFAT